jgi:hypothetical protein
MKVGSYDIFPYPWIEAADLVALIATAAANADNPAHGFARPWAPDPNGQGMGRLLRPWVLSMGNPISRG